MADRPDWVGICGIWGGEIFGGPEWPWYKGTKVHTTWRNIEPSPGRFNFTGLDDSLSKAADRGLYIGIKVDQGDVAPAWTYQHGVAAVRT